MKEEEQKTQWGWQLRVRQKAVRLNYTEADETASVVPFKLQMACLSSSTPATPHLGCSRESHCGGCSRHTSSAAQSCGREECKPGGSSREAQHHGQALLPASCSRLLFQASLWLLSTPCLFFVCAQALQPSHARPTHER